MLRAVRLLPNAVLVGRAGVPSEDAAPQGGGPVEESEEQKALAAAEAEIRKLRSELRDRDASLASERDTAKAMKEEMLRLRAQLDDERARMMADIERDKAAALEAATREGYDAGMLRGYDDGLQKADADKQAEYERRFNDATALLDSLVGSVQDARERLALAHAPEMIRLWEVMLERMLMTRVSLDHAAALRLVDSILKRISDRERVIVYLNPADTQMVESGKEALIDSIRGVKVFELLSDEFVEKGSCLIETNLGIYDARWRTQLEQVSGEVESLLMECIAADAAGGADVPGGAS